MRWKFTGQVRPPFADTPMGGQESVWDYPRPPSLHEDSRWVEVYDGDALLAVSSSCIRILETASPPTFYIPPRDVQTSLLTPLAGDYWCEWKGRAIHFGSAARPEEPALAWCYPAPRWPYRGVAGYFSFHPSRVSCFLDGEAVRPQPGDFYGGWVTKEIIGPCKGGAGTEDW